MQVLQSKDKRRKTAAAEVGAAAADLPPGTPKVAGLDGKVPEPDGGAALADPAIPPDDVGKAVDKILDGTYAPSRGSHQPRAAPYSG